MDIVKMEHVTKIYGSGDTRVWALDDVNLTVRKGESLAVVGASGSGKSTLLHVMGGVDTVTNGKVIVDDRDITTLKDEEMSVFRRRKIGFVFQAYHLIPVLSVEENITMPILLDHRKPDKEYVEHIGNPYVYSIDLAAYGTTSLAGDKVRYYYGYGYSMFDDITKSEFNPNYHIDKVLQITI